MRRSLLTALEVVALGVVVAGCALLSVPAALIVAGVAVVAVVEIRS